MFPLGILLNEILTNSYKYAFPDPGVPRSQTGDIGLGKGEGGPVTIEISVGDNGIGYERDRKSEGFGLMLVKALANELKATTEVRTEGGTVYRFVFPP